MHFFPVIWAFTHVVCELTILLSNQPSCKVNSLCVCVCVSSSYTTLCPGLTGWWLIGLGRDGSSSKILVGKHWGGGGEVKNNKGFYKEYRPKSIKTTSKTIHIIISRGNLSRNPDFFYWIREVWGIFLFSSTNVFFFSLLSFSHFSLDRAECFQLVSHYVHKSPCNHQCGLHHNMLPDKMGNLHPVLYTNTSYMIHEARDAAENTDVSRAASEQSPVECVEKVRAKYFWLTAFYWRLLRCECQRDRVTFRSLSMSSSHSSHFIDAGDSHCFN